MDEGRGAAPVTPRPADKLPLLCARPGNVGVQIDAFRTMKAFHRPRCGQFTERFLGITYENHSMENHVRIVERTQRRAQIVAERLRKLEEHEARLVVMEQQRRVRWQQLEAAQQRRLWLMRQAAKRQELRRQEEEAAVHIQRHLRGSVARRVVSLMRRDARELLAAKCLQVFWRRVARAKDNARRQRDEQRARRVRAAQTIQRVTRRRLLSRTLPAVNDEATEHVTVDDQTTSEVEKSAGGEQQQELSDGAERSDQLCPDLSLELLFSATSAESLLETALVRSVVAPPSNESTLMSTHAAPSPRPPVSTLAVKRVGGGFRTYRSPRATAPAVAPTKPSRPFAPQHHQPRQPRPRVPARVSRLVAEAHDPPDQSSNKSTGVAETPLPPAINGDDDDDDGFELLLLEQLELVEPPPRDVAMLETGTTL
ncbi:hypothetical protein PINS_up002396 [Pythium insidiosum]|nr:hypothetical protein PINS_up002396 [Pythium insidiosum]